MTREETRYAMISPARWQDGRRFSLDLVREDLSGLGLPSRRESWTVLARTEQEAHRTVDHHFGRSALWYRLEYIDPNLARA